MAGEHTHTHTPRSPLSQVDLICIFNTACCLQGLWTYTADSELRWHHSDIAPVGRLTGSQQRASLPGHAARIRRLGTLGGCRAALPLRQCKTPSGALCGTAKKRLVCPALAFNISLVGPKCKGSRQVYEHTSAGVINHQLAW